MDVTNITPETLRAAGLKKWTMYPDTIGMWVAESDFGVAPEVQAAIHDAVNRRAYGYIDPKVSEVTTTACADWYTDQYGYAIRPAQIRLVGDVLSALNVTVTHFAPAGAPVVVPTPAYMPFIPFVESLGHPAIQVPLLPAEADWAMDVPAIEAALTPGALLILCNPQNPTGRVYRRDELEALSLAVDRAGARVFSDEIHAPIVFPGSKYVPYSSISDLAASHTIIATSASKAWNMPGLKCAQVIFPAPGDALTFDQTGAWESFGTGILGVLANAAAYRDARPWLADFTALVDSNMAALEDQLQSQLPEAVFTRPEGTFLAWIDLRAYGLPDGIGPFLRREAHVSVTDGRQCGDAGKGFIRLCMATTPAIAEEAVTRIAAVLNR